MNVSNETNTSSSSSVVSPVRGGRSWRCRQQQEERVNEGGGRRVGGGGGGGEWEREGARGGGVCLPYGVSVHDSPKVVRDEEGVLDADEVALAADAFRPSLVRLRLPSKGTRKAERLEQLADGEFSLRNRSRRNRAAAAAVAAAVAAALAGAAKGALPWS